MPVCPTAKQRAHLAAGKWRPNRLQLAQAVVTGEWLATLRDRQKARLHLFHLDAAGNSVRLRDRHGDASQVNEWSDATQLERVASAVAQLTPVAEESRLGEALRQVAVEFRDSPLAGVVMFTDGLTSHGETIARLAQQAADWNLPFHFVGLGAERRELALRDVLGPSAVYRGDKIVFDVHLVGQGFTDLQLPVVLKRDGADGGEKEVDRQTVKIDPLGRLVETTLHDWAKEPGTRDYVVEILPPKEVLISSPRSDCGAASACSTRRRSRCSMSRAAAKRILRYRTCSSESLAKGEQRPVELTVLLLDADDDWGKVEPPVVVEPLPKVRLK